MAKREYVSCGYMEKALIFHPHSIEHCCVPVEGKEWRTPMAAAFHGGPLPVKEILESRDLHRAIFAQIDKHPEAYCNGCVHLERREWDDRYLFNNLHFNQSMVCNLRCCFCVQRSFSREEQTADYDMLPVIQTMLEMDFLDPNAFIFWAGGEPTLLNDFEVAFDLSVRHGTRNEVATNATIFCETLQRHLVNPSVCMKTSVDCGTAETFLRMKRRDWFDRVWENLGRYAATGGNVAAKYIVSHENLAEKDLSGFVDRVRQHGIRSVFVDINHNFKPGETTDEHVYATVLLMDALRAAGVEVECGVHSIAAVPDFNERVNAMRKRLEPSRRSGVPFVSVARKIMGFMRKRSKPGRSAVDSTVLDSMARKNVGYSTVSVRSRRFSEVAVYERVKERFRLHRDARIIRKSGWFDEKFYRRENPDIVAAGVDPIVHYLRHGWREGRKPSTEFDTHYYLTTYTDVVARGVNPLVHFLRHGRAEGRQPLRPTPQLFSTEPCAAKTESSTPADTSAITAAQFTARNEHYFADVVPPILSVEHLVHSRLYPRREDLLNLIPKGGIYAEVGTHAGYFAKQMWEQLSPCRLHILDVNFNAFDHNYFREAMDEKAVLIHEGDFHEMLAKFPDEYFDMIYFDEEHIYANVKKCLEQAGRKIKLDGWILCNDYTVYSPMEAMKYGIPRAVNELCLEHNFEIVALAFHPWGYHDVALRRRGTLFSKSLREVDYEKWRTGTAEELEFWSCIIKNWDKDYMNSHKEELQDFVKDLLSLPPGGFARILDVGSGPVTKLGTQWENRTLDLTLVDPLANEYNQMLNKRGLRTLPRPIKGFAENLVEQFGSGIFDLVFSQNSLDHTINPAKCIREMLGVAKPSGIVAFKVVAHEGQRNGYVGLHQWDFIFRDGEVFLGDAHGGEQSLDDICSRFAVYSAEVKVEPINNSPTDFIYVVILKKVRDSATVVDGDESL